jgi:hypothetical protein
MASTLAAMLSTACAGIACCCHVSSDSEPSMRRYTGSRARSPDASVTSTPTTKYRRATSRKGDDAPTRVAATRLPSPAMRSPTSSISRTLPSSSSSERTDDVDAGPASGASDPSLSSFTTQASSARVAAAKYVSRRPATPRAPGAHRPTRISRTPTTSGWRRRKSRNETTKPKLPRPSTSDASDG